ncbi:SGNH/GDSL hydrolase family protein [Desulfococcaceae bacterium HSG7]|nr:SGNH/GDSL hydrolase family protein [Desulfococcaceae bacterium HSG7]
MKRNQLFCHTIAYTWCGIIIIVFVLSTRDILLQFHLPTLNQLVISIVVLVFLLALSGLIIFRGIKYLLFLAIPYLLCFIILEGGIRIWMRYFAPRTQRIQYSEQFRYTYQKHILGLETAYVPHHYTLYNSRPSFSLEEGTVHNGLGLRDHRNFKPEDQVIKIAFIGGSTTYTIGIKDNTKIFSYGLEQRLNDYYKDGLKGYRIQVINAGMGGATSAENLLRLIFFVSEISPDVVVIQHGLNDTWARLSSEAIQFDFSNYRKRWSPPKRPGLFVPERSLLSAASLTIIKRSLLCMFIIKRIGVTLPSEGLVTIDKFVSCSKGKQSIDNLKINGTQYFERNTRYMIAICRVIGAKVLLASEAYTKKAGKARQIAMPEHNALLAKIAQEEQVYFYDFFADMIKDGTHMPDGLHASQVGSDLKRDLFFDYIIREGIILEILKAKLAHGAFLPNEPFASDISRK